MKVFPNEYFSWPAQAFGFAYGVIVAIYTEQVTKVLTHKKQIFILDIIMLFVLGFVYLEIHTPTQENFEMYIIRIIMSFILIILFLAVSVSVSVSNKFMAFLGKINLYIYLLHGMVIDILRNYLTDGWLILACIVCTVVMAASFGWLTEKLFWVIGLIRKREAWRI